MPLPRAADGRLVWLWMSRRTDEARPLGLRAAFMVVEADQAGMREIAALAEAGLLRPEIDTVLPLEEAAKAHELGDSRRTTGKIVLSVTD